MLQHQSVLQSFCACTNSFAAVCVSNSIPCLALLQACTPHAAAHLTPESSAAHAGTVFQLLRILSLAGRAPPGGSACLAAQAVATANRATVPSLQCEILGSDSFDQKKRKQGSRHAVPGPANLLRAAVASTGSDTEQVSTFECENDS
jgi:hypothetical protein